MSLALLFYFGLFLKIVKIILKKKKRIELTINFLTQRLVINLEIYVLLAVYVSARGRRKRNKGKISNKEAERISVLRSRPHFPEGRI